MTILLNSQTISPYYISGFTDGEGCFTIGLSRKKTRKLGVDITPSFSISQNSHSQNVLIEIQKYFGCGFLRTDRQTMKYEVRKFPDLQEKIRPHFENYLLRTQKQKDFELFCLICDKIETNQIKTVNQFCEIVDSIYKMNNKGENRRYSKQDWKHYCMNHIKKCPTEINTYF